MLSLQVVIWLSLIIIPVFLLSWAFIGRFARRLDFTLHILFAASYSLWMIVAGRWDWASVYLRWVLIAAVPVVIVLAIVRRRKKKPKDGEVTAGIWLGRAILAAGIFWFGLQGLTGMMGGATNERMVSLDFPLKGGSYYIGQGGTSAVTNQHHGVPAQNYALDINKLSSWGNRARVLVPGDISDYAIFGEPVYSPCRGTVVRAIDGRPDERLGERDPNVAPGNHVWVRCKWVDVLLAHLQEGSVEVRAGQTVESGDPIGKVGNSGNTTAPHLHLHAQKSDDTLDYFNGEGVPMRLNGEFRARNDILKP